MQLTQKEIPRIDHGSVILLAMHAALLRLRDREIRFPRRCVSCQATPSHDVALWLGGGVPALLNAGPPFPPLVVPVCSVCRWRRTLAGLLFPTFSLATIGGGLYVAVEWRLAQQMSAPTLGIIIAVTMVGLLLLSWREGRLLDRALLGIDCVRVEFELGTDELGLGLPILLRLLTLRFTDEKLRNEVTEMSRGGQAQR